nr:unnamed protein product [Digitaria exilis]
MPPPEAARAATPTSNSSSTARRDPVLPPVMAAGFPSLASPHPFGDVMMENTREVNGDRWNSLVSKAASCGSTYRASVAGELPLAGHEERRAAASRHPGLAN